MWRYFYACLQHLVSVQAHEMNKSEAHCSYKHINILCHPPLSVLMCSTYIVAGIITPNHVVTKAKEESNFPDLSPCFIFVCG